MLHSVGLGWTRLDSVGLGPGGRIRRTRMDLQTELDDSGSDGQLVVTTPGGDGPLGTQIRRPCGVAMRCRRGPPLIRGDNLRDTARGHPFP